MSSTLKALKALDLDNLEVHLAVVNSRKRGFVRFVEIGQKLEKRLRGIVAAKIRAAGAVEPFAIDGAEPDDDSFQSIEASKTDFASLFEETTRLPIEDNKVEGKEELLGVKAYMIVLKDAEGIKLMAYRRVPESWKTKSSLITLVMREAKLEDLDEDRVFRINSSIDFIFFCTELLVLSRKNFETALRFRDGMIAKRDSACKALGDMGVVSNVERIKEKVGTNVKFLRLISSMEKSAHYKDASYMERLAAAIGKNPHWGIKIEGNQLTCEDENIETLLRLLGNKRMWSPYTEKHYDVNNEVAVA